MNYKDQIKSPKWQKKRLEVLNLRGFKCESCGNEEKQLHVHHTLYIKGRLIHEYDNDIFQVLCEDCHKAVHDKLDDKYASLIKLINDYSITNGNDIIDHLVFILSQISKDSNYDSFIQNLSNAFNNQYSLKIAIELDLMCRLEYLEIRNYSND